MNTPFVPSCLRANHSPDDRIMGEPEHMLVFEPPSAYSVLPAREDLHTEFKEARSGLPGNLCDTLCAFLNTDGGTLYLGVGDKGEVLGLEPEQIERFDQLGSGVLNIHKYWPIYATGAEPIFRETHHGFELILPLPGAPTTEAKPVQVTAPVEALVTAPVTAPVEAPVTAPVGNYVAKLLRLLGQEGPLGNEKIRNAFSLQSRRRVRDTYIDPALAAGLIERTLPDKPNSRLQKYRLTEKGRAMAGGGPAQA